mmetsp:Transcript_26829/g.79284  ORF Transcript_26829/g.79284 Transcript_26829/m.79284 type:complete len:180 (-) Transcript_26829:382-921(-)
MQEEYHDSAHGSDGANSADLMPPPQCQTPSVQMAAAMTPPKVISSLPEQRQPSSLPPPAAPHPPPPPQSPPKRAPADLRLSRSRLVLSRLWDPSPECDPRRRNPSVKKSAVRAVNQSVREIRRAKRWRRKDCGGLLDDALTSVFPRVLEAVPQQIEAPVRSPVTTRARRPKRGAVSVEG